VVGAARCVDVTGTVDVADEWGWVGLGGEDVFGGDVDRIGSGVEAAGDAVPGPGAPVAGPDRASTDTARSATSATAPAVRRVPCRVCPAISPRPFMGDRL
jgi:hypothetical protein